MEVSDEGMHPAKANQAEIAQHSEDVGGPWVVPLCLEEPLSTTYIRRLRVQDFGLQLGKLRAIHSFALASVPELLSHANSLLSHLLASSQDLIRGMEK